MRKLRTGIHPRCCTEGNDPARAFAWTNVQHRFLAYWTGSPALLTLSVNKSHWYVCRPTARVHPGAQASTGEGIDNLNASLRKVDEVSRYDRQTVSNRGRRDEAVLDRHGFPGFAEMGQQFRPFQAGVRIPGKTVETPDSAG